MPPLAPGAAAPAAPPPAIDGLRTVNFERRIIQDIQAAHPGNALGQLNAFAYCLSQALASHNEPFSDLVASALKSRILVLARLNPNQAQLVLAQREFCNSEQSGIKDLIKRVDYYNSNALSKFLHHLHGGLESDKTVSGRAFYAGITLIFGGAATHNLHLMMKKLRKSGLWALQ